jgi:hypothetical protein
MPPLDNKAWYPRLLCTRLGGSKVPWLGVSMKEFALKVPNTYGFLS